LESLPGAKSELDGLSLTEGAEGGAKMAWRQTSQRRSGGSISTAKIMSTLPGSKLKKAKNKCASIYNCLSFIEIIRELSKHTSNCHMTSAN
jgi:hypothetical protein